MYFERDARWFGTDYLQTLEPRVYYLYVPFKDQTNLPVFDTTNTDLSFAQLFQENIFAGGDRIANANQVSYRRHLAAGAARPTARSSCARSSGSAITSPTRRSSSRDSRCATGSFSPVILGLSGRVAPNWTVDLGLQYRLTERLEPREASDRRALLARAGVGREHFLPLHSTDVTAGAGEINTSTSPRSGRSVAGFYGVGRASYDLDGSKIVDAARGLEYNADCWIVRAVAQQFQTGDRAPRPRRSSSSSS